MRTSGGRSRWKPVSGLRALEDGQAALAARDRCVFVGLVNSIMTTATSTRLDSLAPPQQRQSQQCH